MSLSLTGKRILAFAAYALLDYILAIVFFLIPLSVWAVYSDPSGSGSGYFIAGLIFVAPVVAAPGAIISGFLALWIIDRALKATNRSSSEYVTYLVAIVVCAFISIVTTYGVAWVGSLIL